MYKKSALVVGAGLSGLTASGLLAARGYAVDLIDSASSIGGVMASRDVQGIHYDNGTHIISDIGIDEIDQLLLEPLDLNSGWNQFSAAPSSCFFNGTLSNLSFIDARLLDHHIYKAGLQEMLSLRPPSVCLPNLEKKFLSTFGKIFTSEIFTPSINKFTDCDPHLLNTDAHSPFALTRIICCSPEEALDLKNQSAWNDSRFAYHDCAMGTGSKKYLYPNTGGLQTWVDSVSKNLCCNLNVQIQTSVFIKSITCTNKEFLVETQSSGAKRYDALVWSISPSSLLPLMGQIIPKHLSAPEFASVILFDLEFNTQLNSNLKNQFYITCYDPNFIIFRVTLYNVLEQLFEAPARITVEVIDHNTHNPTAESLQLLQTEVIQELIAMGVVSSTSTIVNSAFSVIKNAYPKMTLNYSKTKLHLLEHAQNIAPNVVFIGRASLQSFSQESVLHDVYNKITALA